ncbi:hypothetical protein [Streptomyces uncialis]|uniref:hypothetical protein n=1 Tax=Streptomyces uncialis TaxID=1048205 RepID=UPI0015B7BE03|nr:hypothetical protein [Streptomyces uncialis]
MRGTALEVVRRIRILPRLRDPTFHPEIPERSSVVLKAMAGPGSRRMRGPGPPRRCCLDALREVISDGFSVKFSLLN